MKNYPRFEEIGTMTLRRIDGDSHIRKICEALESTECYSTAWIKGDSAETSIRILLKDDED